MTSAGFRVATLALALLLFALLSGGHLRAQQPPQPDPALAPTVAGEAAAPAGALSAAEIRRFIETLEDEQQRTRLIESLRVLSGVDPQEIEAPPADSALDRVTRLAGSRLEAVSAQISALGRAVAGLPQAWTWAEDQVRNPVLRARWIEIGTTTLVGFGLGLLAFLVVGAATRRYRERIDGVQRQGIWRRVANTVVTALIDAARLAAFGVVTYVLIGILSQSMVARLLLVGAVNAVLLLGALRILGRALLAPRAPGNRLLPLADETAAYLYLWLNRFLFIAVPAHFLASAAWLLGLPRAASQGLLTVVWLVLGLLAVVFILQLRKPVGDAIRGGTAEGWVGVTRRRVADVWHIVALLYVAVLFGAAALHIEGAFAFLFEATLATMVTLLVAAAAMFLLRRAVDRAFRIDAETARLHPGLEKRANRYLPVLRHGIVIGTTVIAALFILEAWHLGGLSWLADPLGRRIAGTLVSIGFVLLLGVVAWEVVSNMIERGLTTRDSAGNAILRSARQRTLLPLMRNAFLIFLVTVMALIILSELGVDIAPLLAGAGVVGLAIGFGAQKLVQDVITGVFILVEDTMKVGDVVNLGANSGVVEGISIRSVRLRDMTGTVHTVPFSQVNAVMNLTKDFSFYVFDIGVAYRENLDDVIAVVRQLGAEMQADPNYAPFILEPIEIIGVDAFRDSAVIIKARFKTLPIRQWMVGREFNRRMKARFDELGIEIPFPHMTLYFGQDKQGGAPPANLRLREADLARTLQAAAGAGGEAEGRGGPAGGASGPRTSSARGEETPRSTPGHDD